MKEPADLEEGIKFEKHNWSQARERFLAAHKDSDSRTLQDFLKSQTSIDVAKSACRNAQRNAEGEFSPALGGILEKIDVAMRVGDLAMKSAPESIGLAWTGVRLCFHSVSDDFSTFSLFINACSDIIGILISCGVYGQMYGTNRGPQSFQELHSQVVDLIPSIYADILAFSYAMNKHMQRNKATRLLKGTFYSYESKFKLYMRNIHDADTKMREFARQASERLSIYYLEKAESGQTEMKTQLSRIEESLSSSMETNKILAERLHQAEEERKLLKNKTPLELALEAYEANKKALFTDSDQKASFESKLRLREPDTCLWIFDHDEWNDWKKAGSNRRIWLSGGGGFGKSIIVSTVVEKLLKEDEENAEKMTVYFFCNNGDDSTRTTKNIQAHLMYQLYEQIDQSLETLKTANDVVSAYLTTDSKKKKSFTTSFVELTKVLKKEVRVVIDAMDECVDRQEQHLLKSLHTITEDESTIRVFVCGRPDDDIATGLEDALQIKVEGNNHKDIRTNAKSLLSKMNGWTNHELLLAEEAIVEKAGSYFRYVELAIEFLRQPWRRPLSNRLKQLPEGLDASYRQVLDNVDPNYRELLQTTLTYLILAQGEITISEVVDAYSRLYTEDITETNDEPMDDAVQNHSIDLYVKQIRYAGSSLLVVNSQSGTLGLRHSTVGEYFLKQNSIQDESMDDEQNLCTKCQTHKSGQPSITVTAKDGHLEIAITILRHLLSPSFRRRYLKDAKAKLEKLSESRKSSNVDEATAKEAEDKSATSPTTEAKASADIVSSLSANESSVENPETQDNDTTAKSEVGDDKDSTAPEDSNDLTSDANTANPDEEKSDSQKEEESDDNASEADSDIEQDEPSEVKSSQQSRNQDHANTSVRYEIRELPYHLQLLESLWPENERKGARWMELWELIDEFFRADNPAFNEWALAHGQMTQARANFFTEEEDGSLLPVHIIAAYGLIGIAERFHSAGSLGSISAPTHDKKRQAIHFAIEVEEGRSVDEKLDTIAWFLDHDADINAESKMLATTPLLKAAMQDASPKVLNFLFDRGADVKISDSSNYDVVHYFTIYGEDIESLKVMLDRGASPDNQESNYGETPLHSLLTYGFRPSKFRVESAKLLLDRGANCDRDDYWSERPLFEAAARNEVGLVELLLNAGADIHDTSDNGLTALHVASKLGSERQLETVRLLVDRGANVTGLTKQGYDPFTMACRGKNPKTAEYLLSIIEPKMPDVAIRANKKRRNKTPLMKVAARNCQEILKLLLSRSDVLETIDSTDNGLRKTALHLAAQNGHPEAVKILVESGASTAVTDSEENTPLQLCCLSWREQYTERYAETSLFLLSNTQFSADEATSILGIAAMHGNIKVIEKLLQLGADPTHRDDHGWTAIDTCRQYKHPKAISVLSGAQYSNFARPTRFHATTHAQISISEDGLELENLKSDGDLNWTFLTNHPIPAVAKHYYFEISIISTEKTESAPPGAIGFSSLTQKTGNWMPGLVHPRSSTTYSWGYFGDEGSLKGISRAGNKVDGGKFATYGSGDIVGCGIDITEEKIFFTKNGERLMDVAFDKVNGRLYPAVGIAKEAKIQANLGGVEPFKWTPGNEDKYRLTGKREDPKGKLGPFRAPLRSATMKF